MSKELSLKPKTSLALNTFFSIGKANGNIVQKANEHIKLTGLTPVQFAIINVLGSEGSMKISEIYSRITTKSGNKTMILDLLEKKNFVRRVYSKNDRREIIIELTAAGKKFFDKNFKPYSEFIENLFSPLSQSEQKELIALLEKIDV